MSEKKEEDKKGEENKKEGEGGGENNEEQQLINEFKQKEKTKPFYDENNKMGKIKLTAQEKKRQELLRRWNVKLINIEIYALYETFDPFLQIVIGGDFQREYLYRSDGKKTMRSRGKRGFIFKTNCIKNLDKNKSSTFYKTLNCEIVKSYAQIKQERMHFELWDWNGNDLNVLLSYQSIPLEDIVSGDIDLTLDFKKKVKKMEVNYATIYLKCFFQEIWDFYITFKDFMTGDISDPHDPNKMLSPRLTLTLDESSLLKQKIQTEIIKNDNHPFWGYFAKPMLFRGTANQLQQQSITITLEHHSKLAKKFLGSKTVSLLGVLDHALIKTQMHLIHNREIQKEGTNATVQGIINFGFVPKFRQKGDLSTCRKNERYLMIKIARVDNLDVLEDVVGDIKTYVTVEWGGIQRSTRVFKGEGLPAFNETFHFLIPLSQKEKENEDLLRLALENEFKNKGSVLIELWHITGGGSIQHLGSTTFYLSEIQSSKIEDIAFMNDEKETFSFSARTYNNKKRLTSAFFEGANTSIYFKAWFMEDIPQYVDLTKYKKEGDQIHEKIAPFFLNSRYLTLWNNLIRKNEENAIHRISNRKFDVNELDQYNKDHFMPIFLSKISSPDSAVIGNATDFKIRTLDEIAHYVRCIPFSSNEKSGFTLSPNFTLSLKWGDNQDHAILMACMFMGCRYETLDELKLEIEEQELIKKKKKRPKVKNPKKTKKGSKYKMQRDENDSEDSPAISERVYVCIGTLKNTRQRHFWCMTISKDCEKVTFWEPVLHKKFVMRGRVRADEKQYLKLFLSNRNWNNEKHSKKQPPKKTKEIHDKKGKDKNTKDKNKEKRDLFQLNISEGIEENKYLEKEKEFDDLGNEKFLVHDLKQDLRNLRMGEIGTIMGVDHTTRKYLQEQEGYENKLDEDQKEKERENIDLEKLLDLNEEGPNHHLLPVEIFKEGNKELEQVALPYETLDVIFNASNAFANMQYHDPARIYYHLHNDREWLPFVRNPDIFNFEEDKQEREDAESSEEEISNSQESLRDFEKSEKIKLGKEEFNRKMHYIKFAWKAHFQSFYNPSSFKKPIMQHETEKYLRILIKEVKAGITTDRSAANLQTRWKPMTDELKNTLKDYLDLLEHSATSRLSEQEEKERKKDFEKTIKAQMPVKYRFQAQPIFFNYLDAERIKSVIIENSEKFYKANRQGALFALEGKIYAYFHEISCVRLIVVIFYPIPLEELESTEVPHKSKKSTAINQ